MSVAGNFFLGVLKIFSIGVAVGWFTFLIVWIIRIIKKKFPLFFKYKMLKKTPDIDITRFCLEKLDSGRTESHIRKELLLQGKLDRRKIEEIVYIFVMIRKLKGGKNGKIKKGFKEGSIENV